MSTILLHGRIFNVRKWNLFLTLVFNAPHYSTTLYTCPEKIRNLHVVLLLAVLQRWIESACCCRIFLSSFSGREEIFVASRGKLALSLCREQNNLIVNSMADDDGDHLGSGLSSIVRMAGANVPARARFSAETLVSATFSSITFGMLSGALGSVVVPAAVGPLIPFLVGSSVGYSFGLYQMWANSKRRMLWYAKQYPSLLAHSLRTEHHIIVPSSVVKATQENEHHREEFESSKTEGAPSPTLDQWIIDGGLGLVTWSVLAAQECREDAEAIQKQQRQIIVDTIGSGDEG